MRVWILGVLLTGALGGGVAYVVAGKQTPSCGEPSVAAQLADGCTNCVPTIPTDDAEVSDLSGLLAAAADTGRPRVSFDEPAFASRPAALITSSPEMAPAPRRIPTPEIAPMPRSTR